VNDLNGKHVLVDAYNLRLPYVTGVRTYAETLIRGLRMLGARVSVLWDSPSAATWPVGEVVAFDANRWVGRLAKFRTALELGTWGATASTVYKSKRVTIPPPGYEFIVDVDSLYTVPWCYEASNHIYHRLHKASKLRIRNEGVHVWHATYPIPIDVKGAIKITTVHDLVPIRMPYTTLDIKKDYYNLIMYSLYTSSAVFAVSEYTRRDILDVFPDCNPDKIIVTYQAVIKQDVSDDIVEITMRKFKLKPGQFILFVGTIEPKKNVGRLIDAYAGIDTDMPLVIVGRKGWLWEGEIRKLEFMFGRWYKKVLLLEHVTRTELYALYSAACCLAFPSLYEGFGLPTVEAMALGTPVVCSQVTSLPEVCGDAAVYVDPYDISSIRRGIESVIGDAELRKLLSCKGREQARKFSIERYAEVLRSAYSRVLSS